MCRTCAALLLCGVRSVDGSGALDADEFHALVVRLSSRNYSGDVKYHLGTTSKRKLPSGPVELTLLANPSHLEAVNPLVSGRKIAKTRIYAFGWLPCIIDARS
jgi:hypothetical protein